MAREVGVDFSDAGAAHGRHPRGFQPAGPSGAAAPASGAVRALAADRSRGAGEMLMWIARGKSNRDIAEILSLSPRTVNKHLEQVYAKLGVENRAAAAALAVRMLGVR